MREIKATNQSDFLEILENHIRDIANTFPHTIEAMLIPCIVDCSYENRSAIFELTVSENSKNFSGTLYGGVLAAIFDNVTGILMRCYSGRYSSPTIELNMCFHRPAFVGDTMKIFVEIISTTTSFIDLYAVAYTKKRNNPVASATVRYFLQQ
jgi:acyl-coenzyme A thioesterase PaaI-like protein